MPIPSQYGAMTLLLAVLALVCACSDSNNNGNSSATDEYLAIGLATVEPPPAIGSPFLLTTVSFDLGDVGYQQAEHFLSGTATATYKTRIVVYSPINPAPLLPQGSRP